jgi:uncharacterized protein (UPF0332 family)
MMPRDFIALASTLAAGTTEAEWRTAASRAYYAAFHGARALLTDLGFTVPRAEAAHQYVYRRLNNCGEPTIQKSAADLDGLRSIRNRADYDWHIPFPASLAPPLPNTAEQVVVVIDAARSEPTRTQITDAMKDYERRVLGVVTWHP